MKRNFFAGRKFINEDDIDKRLFEWVDIKCNRRIHGTIRKIPYEVFETEERKALKKLPQEEYTMSKMGVRKVYHDCHVFFEYNYYSVPFEYVGESVDVEANDKLIRISLNGKVIATHRQLEGKGSFSTNEAHYPKYKIFSETEAQEEYQAKMKNIGSFAEQIFFLTVETNPKGWGQSVRGILSLEKEYPKEVINASCKRALVYNTCSYNIIKNICKEGTYNLPIEFYKEG